MELLEQLERRMDMMLARIKELEDDNRLLQLELEEVKHNRDDVLERIDRLLNRVQEELA